MVIKRKKLGYKKTKTLVDIVMASKEAHLAPKTKLILKDRYLKKNVEGIDETPKERYAAIAVNVASAELNTPGKTIKDVEDMALGVYDAMVDGRFLFNTPTLINFGRWELKSGRPVSRKQMGSACFVLPLDDEMVNLKNPASIMMTSVAQAAVHKWGGGTGYSLARLRPAGSIIQYDPEIHGKSSFGWGLNAGISSGPVSFLEHILDSNTESIKQGNTRRGANMAIQRIDHPDFLAHMYAKFGFDKDKLEKKVPNHNLSMGLTDDFMEAAKNNGYSTLYNPHTEKNIKRYDLCTQDIFEDLLKQNQGMNRVTLPSMYLHKNGRDVVNAFTGDVIGLAVDEVHIHARTVMHEMAKLSYSNGEPGVVFLDRMNQFNPTPHLGEIEATNPCGEQPLLPFEACNLGSINVAKYISNGGKLNKKKLKEDIKLFVRALDNVVTQNDFPQKEITDMVNSTRKIGLGYMGVADAMVLMGVKYGSEESFDIAEDLAHTLSHLAREASVELGEEKGEFPAFEGSIYDPKSEAHKEFNVSLRPLEYKGKPRNAACTTQAPTGTLSRLANCSSGIEPLFSLVTVSNILEKKIIDVSYALQKTLLKNKIISQDTLDNLDKLVADDNDQLHIIEADPHVMKELKVIKAIYDNGNRLYVDEDTPVDIKDMIELIPEETRDLFVQSSELSGEQHLLMQAAFQKYNDSSISKTVNLPKDSGIDSIQNIFFEAWELGVKGLTIYREGSRDIEVLKKGGKEKAQKSNGKYHRPILQESITMELPIGNPLLKPGEVDTHSETIFTTIAYDPISGRINSIFHNGAYGTSFDKIDLIGMGLLESEILKKCNGDPSSLEKVLSKIPAAHQVGMKTENGGFQKVTNDTEWGAGLKALQVLKFLTNGYTDYDSMRERSNLITDGKVSIAKIIESGGTVEYKEEDGNPSIFPKGQALVFDAKKYAIDQCPYCKTEFPTDELKDKYIGFLEGCILYKCCETSKCG